MNATFQTMLEEHFRLKRMKKMAESLPQSDVRGETIHRIDVELLYLKLRLNAGY